ncbi:hypothetical protein FKM82_003401 [Ascaphus truei]
MYFLGKKNEPVKMKERCRENDWYYYVYTCSPSLLPQGTFNCCQRSRYQNPSYTEPVLTGEQRGRSSYLDTWGVHDGCLT